MEGGDEVDSDEVRPVRGSCAVWGACVICVQLMCVLAVCTRCVSSLCVLAVCTRCCVFHAACTRCVYSLYVLAVCTRSALRVLALCPHCVCTRCVFHAACTRCMYLLFCTCCVSSLTPPV
jgi:hypothetical protein